MKETAREINRETGISLTAVRVRRDGTLRVQPRACGARFGTVVLIKGAIIYAAFNLFA